MLPKMTLRPLTRGWMKTSCRFVPVLSDFRSIDRAGRRSGFTLIEILVVLVIAAIGTGIAVSSFGLFQARASARGAAQTFSRDLAQARAWARRSNEPVTVNFDETAGALRYTVVGSAGDTIADRRFGAGGEIRLDSIQLGMEGDTLRFGASGIADLSTASPVAPTANALFFAGARSYRVRFNASGSSVVEPGS